MDGWVNIWMGRWVVNIWMGSWVGEHMDGRNRGREEERKGKRMKERRNKYCLVQQFRCLSESYVIMLLCLCVCLFAQKCLTACAVC